MRNIKLGDKMGKKWDDGWGDKKEGRGGDYHIILL